MGALLLRGREKREGRRERAEREERKLPQSQGETTL